jgi:phenylacetate-coenzyme A ligase PaaK-like adenylate-forming protein
LEGFLKSGISRNISFLNPPIKRLRDALAENSVGYLIAYPWVVDLLLQDEGEDFLHKVDVKMWIPIGFAPDQNLTELFKSAEIPIRGTYSSEEVGQIGSMCPIHQDYYHIAGSNVLVEVEKERYFVRNKKLGRILITHLHSYGTPFIRYDIGDIGSLEERCPCGFDGPVLRDIVGRSKNLLMHPDGNVSYFHVEPRVEKWLTKFSAYRFKQTAIDTVTVEVGGCESLAGEDEQRFIDLVRRVSGFDFKVKVHAISKIDWGDSIKKHSFINEII